MPTIPVYLPDDTYDAVRRIAEKEGIGVGKAVRYIVESYILIQKQKGEL